MCLIIRLVAPLFDPVAIQNGNWEMIAKNAAIDMANVREVGPFVRKWERVWIERLCGVSVESDGLERAKDTHRHERVEADNRMRRVARRLAFPFISILVLPFVTCLPSCFNE